MRIAPGQIERVLRNLLANAVRHTPANGVVSVTVEPDTDHVLVSVEDTAPGLPPNGERVAFTLPLAEPPPSRERA